MIDWNKIDDDTFENLAYEYVSSKYPEVNWEPTKTSWDGNKDGEAVYTAPLSITIKYWYEAKYSKSPNKSIPKSHLDSTLVSCLLDGKVVLLAFITNAYISDDYKRRADMFSKQRDNLKIIYINGDEIEEWLCDNPEIEIKYFFANNAKRHCLKNHVKGAYILQNYDLYGNHFSKVKNVECGKEYVLYLSFYSICNQVVSISSKNKTIEMLNAENKEYNQYDNLNSIVGFNSFYVPIKIKEISNKPFIFNISCNNGELDFTVYDINVINIYNPQIIYGSQIEIKNKLFSLINGRDTTNAIFYIVGDAGSGKSYLLNDIFKDSMNPFSSYVISFTGDEDTDTLLCYRLIIISLFGDVWEYVTDNYDQNQFEEIELLMIQQIKNNKLSGDSIYKVTLYYENNKKINEKNATHTQILVDDFHKLSSRNFQMIEKFYNWFIRQKCNCKIFVFSRPDSILTTSYTKKFVIKNLEPNDIEATVIHNFKNHKYLPEVVKKYPLPLNALHFVNILCQIHSYENDFLNMTVLESQILLNKIYDNSKDVTCLSFGNQIIFHYKNNPVVYCVFKIKTGICIKAIAEYFSECSYDEIYDLCQKRIFKESSNIIFPYHDILVSAFDSINSTKMNNLLEDFVLFAQSQNYISKAKMFSVLIGIGRQCFWKYRNEASLYRDELHECAEYYQALEIAQRLKESNSKNLDNYDINDCKNQFVMANCIKYTNSYKEANNEFEKIKNIYELTNNPDIYGLYLEAETEIINNLIWMLELNTAKEKLKNLSSIFEDLYSKNKIIGHHFIYAFLNYYNRLMFVNCMLDEGSEDDYNNAIKYSKEFNRKEYEAFATMDYAKSLYHKNIKRAQILMNNALEFLVTLNERRRTLDAEAEKCFISDIIGKTISYNIYSDLKNKMRQHHYIQSEIKTQLKLIMLELLFSDISSAEIRNHLYAITVNNPAISSGKRHQAFINHLYAASYYKESNLIMSKKYSLKSLEHMKNAGATYQFVHINNSNLINNNGFITINDITNINMKVNNKFVFDIRIW